MYSSGVKRVKTAEKTLPHYFMTEIKLFLHTPRRLMERNGSTAPFILNVWHQMKVSGQLHSVAPLPLQIA